MGTSDNLNAGLHPCHEQPASVGGDANLSNAIMATDSGHANRYFQTCHRTICRRFNEAFCGVSVNDRLSDVTFDSSVAGLSMRAKRIPPRMTINDAASR